MRPAQLVNTFSSNGVVCTPGARSRDKQKIPRPLDVGILAEWLRLTLNDSAIRLCHVACVNTNLQPDANIVQFRIKIQRMYSAFTPNSRDACASEGRPQVAQKPAVHPRNSHIHLPRHSMAAL